MRQSQPTIPLQMQISRPTAVHSMEMRILFRLLNIDEMHKEENMKHQTNFEKRQRDCAGGHVTGRRDRLILTLPLDPILSRKMSRYS